MEYHNVTAQEAIEALDTGELGLSQADADDRIEKFGFNRLPEPPSRNPFVRFLAQFNNILIYVLIAAAAITAMLAHYTDTGVILAVVLVNAMIGYVQEGRAEQAIRAIRGMLAPVSSVLRDGRRQTVDAVEIVPGDIVLLEAGDRVPADIRLVAATGLRLDEAILTGESVPVDKFVRPVAADVALGDRICMAYSGTLVTAGAGRGVAVATGEATEIGRISRMLSRVETLTTPLVQQMDNFARWLTILILLVAAILLTYGYFVSHLPFPELFLAVVGLSVAAIPEGLPAVLTITLAVGVQAMARRNAIVRRLPAIETLGSVSVICTDKTGTLTRNEMVVASVATAEHIFSVTGSGYAPNGALHLADAEVDPADHDLLIGLARAAALCNDAELHAREDGWQVEGDPMEGALKALAGKIMRDDRTVLAGWSRVDSIPFDATSRYMAVLYRNAGGHPWAFVKGAPERILSMCAHAFSGDGAARPIDTAFWEAEIAAIASQGQRVLALAARQLPDDTKLLDEKAIDGKAVLLGLVGLIDPPRPEAVAAVAECHSAGIGVKMITGDHAATAAAIGRQVGIVGPERVLTGADLDRMDDAALAVAVASTNIYARTSPEHKLRLVLALQAGGAVVAMTGDGVNDAPALKRADAGIAMGRKGSEAAKEAAELVLADDNFRSIVAAVREGRTVYDNIKKVISWTLPTNGGEAATIIFALFANLALPVTAIQILWVNLITAATLGVALAFEPTEDSTMQRPPRPRTAPLLSGELVWHIALVSALFLVATIGIYQHAADKGYPPELARTMALNTLVVLEIFHLFFVRNIYGTSLTLKATKGTPVVWVTVIVTVAAQFAVTYFPPLQQIFGTRSVPVADGVLIVLVGVVFFAIIETEKQARLALRRRA